MITGVIHGGGILVYYIPVKWPRGWSEPAHTPFGHLDREGFNPCYPHFVSVAYTID